MAVSRLFRLSAELRNTIYEMTFACETREEIDICNTCPSSAALLGVNRQSYFEGLPIFEKSNVLYWKSNTFIVNVSSNISRRKAQQRISLILPKNLELVEHFELRRKSSLFGNRTISTIDTCGLWREDIVSRSLASPSISLRRTRYIVWTKISNANLRCEVIYCQGDDTRAREVFDEVTGFTPLFARQLHAILWMS